MSKRRNARRYDLSLPVIVRIPTERPNGSQNGKTRDISTRGLYFVIDQDLEAGSELDITLTLPAEITRSSEVFVRALGPTSSALWKVLSKDTAQNFLRKAEFPLDVT